MSWIRGGLSAAPHRTPRQATNVWLVVVAQPRLSMRHPALCFESSLYVDSRAPISSLLPTVGTRFGPWQCLSNYLYYYKLL